MEQKPNSLPPYGRGEKGGGPAPHPHRVPARGLPHIEHRAGSADAKLGTMVKRHKKLVWKGRDEKPYWEALARRMLRPNSGYKSGRDPRDPGCDPNASDHPKARCLHRGMRRSFSCRIVYDPVGDICRKRRASPLQGREALSSRVASFLEQGHH
ncbi:hypothetical protein C8Q77DRAFT_566630 [Trametes polyzona]|nr:hypothetical protein C8Q77DRAFT_566630 [Trametes polyzona]